MTFRHSFPAYPPSGPRWSPAEDEDLRGARAEAVDSLRSTLDRGLTFYWVLAKAASDVARGRRASLTYGVPESGRGARRPDREPAAEDDRSSKWARSRPDPSPAVPVSLEVETAGGGHGASVGGPSDLDDFVRWADPFVRAERSRRAIRRARATARAFESQAAHDLRALLQPLMLHADQLKTNRSHSPEELELLDDLTRAIVEWIEEELDSGRMREDTPNPAASRGETTGMREALEDALRQEARGSITVSIADPLPEVSLKRSHLAAGLRELVRLGGDAPRRLRMEPGARSVSVRLSFAGEPGVADSGASGGDDEHYPPVCGGVLDLVSSTRGVIRIAKSADLHGRVDVTLPSEAGGR